jgi:glutathione peroxidase
MTRPLLARAGAGYTAKMPMHRRSLIQTLALAPFAATAGIMPSSAFAQMSRPTAYAFSFTALDGSSIRLAEHAGKPILVVNTASLCGFTPQYAGLQELWTRHRDRGLLIVAVPSNDFGGQEPGGTDSIEETAQKKYGVSFPIAAKAEVRGASAHPFYRWAALERPGESPRWNFHKYLVGRDGRIVASFPQSVTPDDPRIVAAIERELRP